VLKVKSSRSPTSVSSSAWTAASTAWFTCLTSPGTLQAKKQYVNQKRRRNRSSCSPQVDAERERISLGIKQLAEDPFNNWVALNKKGAIVNGKVTAVDAKGATVELADGVEGYLRASEASRDRVEDATLVLSVGDDVEAKSPALTARTVQSACLFVLKTKLMRKMQSQLLTSRKMQTSLTTQWLKLSKQLKASNIKFSASF
jgi:ribosomal protein S1